MSAVPVAASVARTTATVVQQVALVDVLTGKVPPSGRLSVSVPKNVGTPIARHFGSRYPFGHGHSYTQFDFTDQWRMESRCLVQLQPAD